MEQMPYQPDLDVHVIEQPVGPVITSDWQTGLPVLASRHVTLRELRPSDARSLFAMLTTEEVARFISPPPTTVEGFARFIDWTRRQRAAGTYVCFAVTIQGFDTAIGIFQVRALEPHFGIAEWGFAIGSPFWGTGVFQEGAELVLEFAFETLGVHRLEARCAVKNGRGTGALRKIGAIQEAVLRKSFRRNGQDLDQLLYAVIEDDWRASQQSEQVVLMPVLSHCSADGFGARDRVGGIDSRAVPDAMSLRLMLAD